MMNLPFIKSKLEIIAEEQTPTATLCNIAPATQPTQKYHRNNVLKFSKVRLPTDLKYVLFIYMQGTAKRQDATSL